jgi:hypothetical protein
MSCKLPDCFPASLDNNQTFETFESFKTFETFNNNQDYLIENFQNIANRTLIGTFKSGGLNYSQGMIGNRDTWENSLGVSYIDDDGQKIEGSIQILTKKLEAKFPLVVDFTDEKDVSQFKFFYDGHYDEFGGGRHARFKIGKVISSSGKQPSYQTRYRMYYYPNIVAPGVPMPTPVGFTKYTIVSNGEVQFFDNSRQVCLINEGRFPAAPVMNNKRVIAMGLPDNTVITSYSIGPSKFQGSLPNALFINLSNTIDTVLNDGYFFIENAPPPPTIPPTLPPATPAPIGAAGPVVVGAVGSA